MNLIVLTALIAVCGAAKLDRTYLPPASAKTAGGSPGSLQTPFAGNSFTNGNNGLGGIPKGSYENDFQGVVVDAAAAGTRTSEDAASGLGAPRVSYGSTNSKVGAAAFKTGPAAFRQQTNDGQAASSAVQGSAQEFSGSSNQGSFSGSAQDAFPGSSNQGSFSASSNQGFSASERPRAALDRNAGILRFENEVGPENYHYAFETDNGISAEENGVATNGVQAQGGFSYTSDDGQVYSISYTADENGYRPTGDHLPTPPPIPEEILKSLEQNAREEAAGLVDDGSYNAEKYNAGSDYSERDDANGKFTHQSSNFGRPEADTTASGTFVNQNNQPFRKPVQSNFGSQSLSSGNQNGQSSGFSGQSHGTHATEHDQSNDEAEQSTMDFNGQFGQNSASKQGSSAFGKVMTGSQGQANAFGSFSGAANQAGSGSQGFGAFNAQSNSQSGQSNGFNNNGPKGSSDQGASSGKFEQSGSQNSGNRFSSSTAASAQSGPSSQRFGNRNEYLPPVNRPNQSGRPQNGRIQSNKAQTGRPQTPITGSADTSIQSEKDTKGGSSPTTVPLGQQGLQSESRPQAAVTSFGQPIVASELSSQNGLGSDNQNKPSNGRRPSFTANAFAHGQSSQSNKPNEYLPPDNRRPQNRPQGSNAASQYNQQANGNAQATGNFQSPQGRPEIPSTSSPGSQSTFGSQTQQYNGFQRPQSQRPGQNGNRFPSSQTQTQFGSTSAQSNIGFNAQKATAEPERELTTPLETSSDDIAQAAAQTTAASFTSPAKPNERPSQSSFSGQFTNDNRFSSQPNTRPQASNPRPFSQTRVPTFPTQSSVGQFNQNSQFGNQEQFQSTFNTNDDVQYSSSTQRPSYAQQPQGPNDSYYYNQPSKPFGTPQGSRFPSAPSNQFDRVNQQSSFSQNGQLSSSQQDNVEPTGLPSVQFSGSTKYPMPPTLAPNSPQIQGLFSSQSQGSTKYPRPPTIAPTAPSSQFQSTVSGITQASASPFPSQSPTQASQGQFGSRPSYQQSSQFSQSSQSTNSFAKQPIRPSFGQQSTAISSAPQRPASSAFQSQSLNQDEPAIDNAEKPVPSQQYNGEIYEYNKPAQTLPPPDSTPASSTAGSFGQKFPAQGQQQFGGQSRPQFGQTNDEEDQRPSTQFGGQTSAQASRPQFGSQSRPQFGQTGQSQSSFTAPTQQMTDDKPYGALAQSQNDFAAQTSKRPSGSRPQFGAQPSRPQFGQAQSSLNAQSQSSQQPEEETPEFVSSQTQPEEQQSHSSQGSKNQFGFIPACCKDNAGRKPESQGFGDRFSQTSFAGAQNRPQPTSSFAGKGEEFGGPRSPPSFDEQTGYHY